MSAIAEQKSQLAKLMATENITVQHAKIKTAGFDVKNRVLYLPIWKDMTGVMYDLLSGHEVGHALYTPCEGWHDAVADKSKGKNYKGFLNVVEDARIEKKIKRKYPGLRTSFTKAYQNLFERDFFGVKGRNLNEMPFIDRLNIFSKSQYTADWIEFNTEEQVFARKIQETESWDDVVRLTDEIYQYSKHEQQQLEFEQFDFDSESGDDEDDETDDFEQSEENQTKQSQSSGDDGSESDEQNEGEKNLNETSGDGDSEEDEKSGEAKSSKAEENDGDDETDQQYESSGINRQKESQSVFDEQYDPVCKTDNTYREREVSLVDDKCKEYVYLEVPKPILSNIVTPAKRVHEQIHHYYFNEWKIQASDAQKFVNEFKNKNEKYIGLLAKEFEMRKAAKAYSKSKVSETGDIDIGKLATYKFNDNIFRKVTSVPKGKSHGLILLLDRSGSMSSNMAGSIEQILVLSLFCRKVNIPFVVYGFGDNESARMSDFPNQNLAPSFEKKDFALSFTYVFLREYLNSKMNNVEFNRALQNLILIKKSYEGFRHDYEMVGRPNSEKLSNTPLTQAVVAMAPIMQEFRKVNNLDITNLVIIHDGDTDYNQRYMKSFVDNDRKTKFYEEYMRIFHSVYVLRDSSFKFELKIDETKISNNPLHDSVVQWFKQVTGSKVFGFFISRDYQQAKNILTNHYKTDDGKFLHQKRARNYHQYKEELNVLIKKFRDEKFLSNKCNNFDEFYYVVGGNDLKTENEEIEIDGKVTSIKLKNAFMKFNKKKVVNRVLVSKFIQNIAV